MKNNYTASIWLALIELTPVMFLIAGYKDAWEWWVLAGGLVVEVGLLIWDYWSRK